MGIAAHLTVIWVLLRLLWKLCGPWLSFAGAWVFALAVPNYELVSWSHITSYVFVMALVILSVEQVVFCLEENEIGLNRLIRLIIYLTLACFLYETSNLFTLCIMAVLFIFSTKNRWRAFWLWLPVISYFILSYYNYVVLHFVKKAAGAHGISIGKFLLAVVHVSSWWLYEGLFNGMYSYTMAIRTMFRAQEAMVFKPLAFNNPQVVLELIILIAFAGLLWINRHEIFKRIWLLVMLGLMVFFYTAVIVIGRYSSQGSLLQAIGVNSYYLYPFWAFIVIMAFSLLNLDKNLSRLGRALVIVVLGASVLSGGLQGAEIYAMSSSYSIATKDEALLVTTLDLLIKEKGQEPNFSFYVHPQYPGNYAYDDLHKKGDAPDRRYSFAELLYLNYFRPKDQAKYKFLITPAQMPQS